MLPLFYSVRLAVCCRLGGARRHGEAVARRLLRGKGRCRRFGCFGWLDDRLQGTPAPPPALRVQPKPHDGTRSFIGPWALVVGCLRVSFAPLRPQTARSTPWPRQRAAVLPGQ